MHNFCKSSSFLGLQHKKILRWQLVHSTDPWRPDLQTVLVDIRSWPVQDLPQWLWGTKSGSDHWPPHHHKELLWTGHWWLGWNEISHTKRDRRRELGWDWPWGKHHQLYWIQVSSVWTFGITKTLRSVSSLQAILDILEGQPHQNRSRDEFWCRDALGVWWPAS